MKKLLFILFTINCSLFTASARETLPIKGTVVSAADKHIQYTGRISFTNPERPAWNYPGTQIIAAFEGTSLKMIAKPGSGYYMAQIDQAEPFKVSFMDKRLCGNAGNGSARRPSPRPSDVCHRGL